MHPTPKRQAFRKSLMVLSPVLVAAPAVSPKSQITTKIAPKAPSGMLRLQERVASIHRAAERDCPKSPERLRTEASKTAQTRPRSSIPFVETTKIEASDATLTPFRTVSEGVFSEIRLRHTRFSETPPRPGPIGQGFSEVSTPLPTGSKARRGDSQRRCYATQLPLWIPTVAGVLH